MWTFKSRIDALDAKIVNANETIEKFHRTFAASQSSALIWADSLYAAVATKEIYERVTRVMLAVYKRATEEEGLPVEVAEKMALDETRRMATRMLVQTASYVASQSTGTCSTFYGRNETEVWARLNEEYGHPLAVL